MVTETSPIFNKSDIPRNIAERAYAFSSFTPEKRADSVQEDYVSHMESVYDELDKIAKTDKQKAALKEEFKQYQATYISKRIEVLNAQSRTASPMITGPSKFPTERNRKALDTEQKRRNELLEWDKKAQRAMIKKIDPTRYGISSDRADATDLLQQKIDKAERLQATMTDSNKIVRDKKLTKEQKIEKLQTIDGISKVAAEGLMEPDFVGRLGFASFQLQNNNANIKRMKERIEQLDKSRADDTKEITFEAGKVIDNVEDNRLQIFFDAKPDQETITKLKSSGFRWTPSIGAWQRFRSPGAEAAMQRAIGVEFKKPVDLEPPPSAPTPIEPTLKSAVEPPKEAKPTPVTPEPTKKGKQFVSDYMNEVFMYGGFPMRRADIIRDLDAQGLSLKEREAYLMGLSGKEPLKDVEPVTLAKFREVMQKAISKPKPEKGKAQAQVRYKELMKPRLEAHDEEIKAVNDDFMAGKLTSKEMEGKHKAIHKKTDAMAATMRKKAWGEYPETLPSRAELEKVQRMRSPRSQASDLAQQHSVVINPDDPKVATWLHDQGRADISGIDTPPISKRARLRSKTAMRITPETPKLRR